MRIAILGAGMAGASAARRLADAGHEVVVFDKARGTGGRMATRRSERGSFDHGAQYFTLRDSRSLKALVGWQAAGVVAPWQARVAAIDSPGAWRDTGPERRWVAVPGMPALARHLLDGISLRLEARVVRVHRSAREWQLEFADGSSLGGYEVLLSTLPAPQAADLLAGEALAAQAAQVTFLPCWAGLCAFDQRLPVAFDAAFVNVGALSWIARDATKPGRTPGERWVVHAGPAASLNWLEDEPEPVLARLLQAMGEVLGIDLPAPSLAMVHRWRYALAATPSHCGALWDPARGLGLGGDWCAGSRVEGAFLSGLALAERVIARIQTGLP
jgi:predicted NAD/FAD-dependent oxidoreductase